jgi:16S rRNA (guanine527-N7)-methyltransferase
MAETLRIEEGLAQFPFPVEKALAERLAAYVQLLQRWNNAYNLTAIRDPEQIVSHHLMDCLAIAPMIHGVDIVDVGSGAGLPGIPLALHYPQKKFTLLDSNGKKTRFLTQVKIDLAIDNVSIEQGRVEDVSHVFDQVICRAFAPLGELANSCAHLLGANGTLLAMKGANQELLSLDSPLELVSRRKLNVPLLGEDRFVITLAPREP